MTISVLTDKDVKPLVDLVNSAYRGDSSKKGWTTEADLLDGMRTDEEYIKELLQKKGSTILIANNDTGHMVGCVYLQQEDQGLYLGMLTVSPEIQSRGIGKQLLQAAETHAINNHCHYIKMTVLDVRHELIAWYERHGYVNTGATKPFELESRFGIPKQPLQFIIIKKDL